MTHVNFFAPGFEAIKATVKEKMEIFGSVGKAEYDFVPHLRKARGGLLLQSSFLN